MKILICVTVLAVILTVASITVSMLSPNPSYERAAQADSSSQITNPVKICGLIEDVIDTVNTLGFNLAYYDSHPLEERFDSEGRYYLSYKKQYSTDIGGKTLCFSLKIYPCKEHLMFGVPSVKDSVVFERYVR